MHEVTVSRLEAVPTVVVATSTTWGEWPVLWGRLLEEVWTVVRASDDVSAGRNVMLYRDDVPNVEVGAELLGGSFGGSGRVVVSALPAGEVASTVARGAPSRESLGAAHDAVLEWCRANGRERAGPRWEIYGHWLEDQDSAAFETEIHWLLR
jgi:effector-binding domain-containing protein